jgi:hypothetical protein
MKMVLTRFYTPLLKFCVIVEKHAEGARVCVCAVPWLCRTGTRVQYGCRVCVKNLDELDDGFISVTQPMVRDGMFVKNVSLEIFLDKRLQWLFM